MDTPAVVAIAVSLAVAWAFMPLPLHGRMLSSLVQTALSKCTWTKIQAAAISSTDTFVRAVAGELSILAIYSPFCILTDHIHSPALFLMPNHPGLITVPLGLFPKAPVPEYEFFADHRPEWQPGVEGVVAFGTMPPGMMKQVDAES